jgi:hypothetical protein
MKGKIGTSMTIEHIRVPKNAFKVKEKKYAWCWKCRGRIMPGFWAKWTMRGGVRGTAHVGACPPVERTERLPTRAPSKKR